MYVLSREDFQKVLDLVKDKDVSMHDFLIATVDKVVSEKIVQMPIQKRNMLNDLRGITS